MSEDFRFALRTLRSGGRYVPGLGGAGRVVRLAGAYNFGTFVVGGTDEPEQISGAGFHPPSSRSWVCSPPWAEASGRKKPRPR